MWKLPDDVKNPLSFWKEEKKKKKEPRLGATDLKNAFCVVPSFIYFSSTDFPDTSTEKPRHHLDASVSARLNFKSLGTCQQQPVVNYTTLPTQFFPYNIKISTKCFHSFMSQLFFFFFVLLVLLILPILGVALFHTKVLLYFKGLKIQSPSHQI